MSSETKYPPGSYPTQLHLRVLSDPAYIGPVRRSIEAFCTAHGFDNASVCDIGLCLNEAMANIVKHAYAGENNRPVELDAEFVNQGVTLRLRDWGNGQAPTPPVRHDPLKPGGVGMICLKSLLDEYTFNPMPDGMNLTLRRTLHHGKQKQ